MSTISKSVARCWLQSRSGYYADLSECRADRTERSSAQDVCKDRKPPAMPFTYRGRGCKSASHGYSGRLPIYEIMVVTPALAEGIEKRLPHTKLRQIALADGMVEWPQPVWSRCWPVARRLESVYKLSG